MVYILVTFAKARTYTIILIFYFIARFFLAKTLKNKTENLLK